MKHIRKLTSWLLTIALIFALLPVVAIRARAALSGDGSEGTPYQIYNSDDLKAFRDIVNHRDFDAYAELKDNIELNENEEWTPIGNFCEYTGTFNGQGHSITGLKVSGNSYCGLFGIIGEGGTVRNVSVSGNVTGSGHYVGGVVGANRGMVTNCSNACTVNGRGSVGGVMGYNSGMVTNCYNTGSVTGNTDVGGVAGFNSSNGTVTNCYNTGSVTGASVVGGVAGFNSSDGTVTNCNYRTDKAARGIGDGTGTATPVSNLAIAVTWSDLYDALQSNNSVVLGADVTYGTGGTNANKDLVVPADTTVDLDLTGHVIDRGLENKAAEDSGSVITVKGNLTITDSSEGKTGKITGGNTAGLGGGVNIEGGSFTLEGGTISGNRASVNGGGVFCDGTFKLSGGATISGNHRGTDTNDNVYLNFGKTITVTGALTNTTPIGVTMYDGTGTITSGLGTIR